jgi:hypothetical protein
MNKKLMTRLTGMAGAGLIITQALLPAFAAINITVSGNGAGSNSDVEFDYETETVVSQTNSVSIKNDIDQDADTGNNSIEENTGGDIQVETGSVEQSASVTTVAGANSAAVETCGCDLDLTVAIEKNGADSENDVDFEFDSDVELYQANYVDVDNDVDQDADTGDNELEENTGGDLSLTTGDVEQEVTLHTEAGMNMASIGGSEGGIDLDLTIAENGADSENDIEVELEMETLAVQNNSVDVDNDVDQDADSGDNEIDENTGGDVDVETGAVSQAIDVWNGAGFNALEVDECCDLEGEIVVDKNGADSENDVELELEFESEYYQTCDGYQGVALWTELLRRLRGCEIENDLDQDADTGDNEVEENTGDDLTTGDVEQETTVHNEAGANVIGGEADGEVEVSLDLLMELLEMLLG